MFGSFNLATNLWGEKAKFRYLFLASLLLLFTLLGAKEIWTQEHRWGDIVLGMFYRQDFLHPYLGENVYYDKPLLSYWFIVITAKLLGTLSTISLRLPSALAGLLAVWSIYRLGKTLQNKSLGLLAGWMLLTTFYFIFWARTSSADMLNLAGSIFAIAWYMERKTEARFFDYFIFFMVIALTSLCKGLIGVTVPVIAVLVDMILCRSWMKHLRLSLVFALIPALLIYFLPFWASNHFGGESYGENGLYLVYRENVLRYFEPFDHRGPIYTYFIYLPIYLLPWTLFFIPALIAFPSRFRNLSLDRKWIAFALFAVFTFFTLSGSRRSYYVLPMVPFAILFTADWLLAITNARIKSIAPKFALVIFLILFIGVDLLPAWYYAQNGVKQFAVTLKKEAIKVAPWKAWHVVMLDAESKLSFYLQLPPNAKLQGVKGDREQQTLDALLKAWPVLQSKPPHTIFISRKRYEPLIAQYFQHYRKVELPAKTGLFAMNRDELNAPIAYIPLPD